MTTNWTNITDFGGLLREANTTSPFWTGMLFMIWATLVVTFLPFGTSVAFLSGSFLGLLLGVLLVYMQLVSFTTLMYMVGIIIIIVLVNALFAKKE